MGSGDPSGLQNRRELASLALVSSTLTRFRQFVFRWRSYLRSADRLRTNSWIHVVAPAHNRYLFEQTPDECRFRQIVRSYRAGQLCSSDLPVIPHMRLSNGSESV